MMSQHQWTVAQLHVLNHVFKWSCRLDNEQQAYIAPPEPLKTHRATVGYINVMNIYFFFCLSFIYFLFLQYITSMKFLWNKDCTVRYHIPSHRFPLCLVHLYVLLVSYLDSLIFILYYISRQLIDLYNLIVLLALSWRRGVVVSGVRQWTKLTHVGPGYNWDWWPSSSGYTISGFNQPTKSTQLCIAPGSLNRVPASAGVTAGMSPLPGGR